MRRLAIHRLTALIAITASVLSGCDKTPATQPTRQHERWPATLSELTFSWSAEPEIDLLTQPIAVVRAYFESIVLAGAGGSDDYLYLGFDHAVKREEPVDYSHYSLNLWPELGYPRKSPEVGSRLLHVLRVAQDGQYVTVVMCTWDWGAAVQKPDGRYATLWQAPKTDIDVERISLLAPTGSAISAAPPQKGPSRYAMTDVFGKWRIVGRLSRSAPSDTLGPGTQWPEYHQDLDACQALAPESVERRQFLTTGEHPRSDFPTLPSYPGWPLETQ
ncbi:hypothetical protein [Mycobacterium sp. SA01]|uniref:hypothetical protein n=1 Tax=Mycobacterium sp. SA01 TaxID=3238820 RepID=UPI00351AFA9E